MKKGPDRFSKIPILVMIVGGTLFIIALGWLFINNLQVNSNSGAIELPAERDSGELSHPEIPRAALTDAWKAYQEQSAIFLDVRYIESYQAEHISGAVSIPETDLADRVSELDKNQWIIPYCT
jgi:hypothetical protein